MDGITINIDWVYFLGIMGTLLAVSWQAGSKFSKIETSITGIKDKVQDLKSNLDQRIEDLKTDLNNTRLDVFGSSSPISLQPKGEELLVGSGMKHYIDTHGDELLKRCESKKETNPYEVQEYVFAMFSDYEFDHDTDDQLKRYAFEKGVPMDIIRRVGAIYFRDICLSEFKMDVKELDTKETVL